MELYGRLPDLEEVLAFLVFSFLCVIFDKLVSYTGIYVFVGKCDCQLMSSDLPYWARCVSLIPTSCITMC